MSMGHHHGGKGLKIGANQLLCLVAFVFLAIGITIVTADLVGGEEAPRNQLQQELLKLMSNYTFDLEGAGEFCRSFCRDFQTQTEMEFVKPVIQTDNFQYPALEEYKKKCPGLELNATVGDQFGNLHYGIRHFKLYQVDINNQPADGKEYLFYFDTVVTSKEALEALQDPRTRDLQETYGGGTFYWVDFERCEIRGGAPVDQFGGFSKGAASYNGIVRYKGKHHIFDLSPPGVGPGVHARKYYFHLWTYSEEKGRIQLACSSTLKRTEPQK